MTSQTKNPTASSDTELDTPDVSPARLLAHLMIKEMHSGEVEEDFSIFDITLPAENPYKSLDDMPTIERHRLISSLGEICYLVGNTYDALLVLEKLQKFPARKKQ